MAALFLLLLRALALAATTRRVLASPPPLQVKMQSLTTEFLTDPLGVDMQNPSVSWIFNSTNGDDRGIYQTSYQLKVSTSFDVATKTQVNWSCPTVTSSQTQLVPLLGQDEWQCPGLDLQSDTQYEWQVLATVQQLVSGKIQKVISPKATFRAGLMLDDSDLWVENECIAVFLLDLSRNSHPTEGTMCGSVKRPSLMIGWLSSRLIRLLTYCSTIDVFARTATTRRSCRPRRLHRKMSSKSKSWFEFQVHAVVLGVD